MSNEPKMIECPQCGHKVRSRGLQGHIKLAHPFIVVNAPRLESSSRVQLETTRDALKKVGPTSKQIMKVDDDDSNYVILYPSRKKIKVEIFIPDNQIEWFHNTFPNHFNKDGYWDRKKLFGQSDDGQYFFQVKKAAAKKLVFYAARRI